jgi:hypothetical protein
MVPAPIGGLLDLHVLPGRRTARLRPVRQSPNSRPAVRARSTRPRRRCSHTPLPSLVQGHVGAGAQLRSGIAKLRPLAADAEVAARLRTERGALLLEIWQVDSTDRDEAVYRRGPEAWEM